MKIKDISLTNFSKYAQVNVSFDDDVTYLIGKNGSGKSTLGITAIWFLFQGIAEKASKGNNPLIGERIRFIGPNGPTAKGEMTLYDEVRNLEIKVHRKLTKSGSELSFTTTDGEILDQQWLTDLFNIFLIAPKKFCELSGKDQACALGIDTGAFDKAIAALKLEYTSINAVVRSYGILEPVEETAKVLTEELQAEKDRIKIKLNARYLENKAANKFTREAWESEKRTIDAQVQEFNLEQVRRKGVRTNALDAWTTLDGLGYNDDYYGGGVKAWFNLFPVEGGHKIASEQYPAEPTNLADLPEDYLPAEGERLYIKEVPDALEMEAIDVRILNASKTNEKALLYTQYLEKKKAKEDKELELEENKEAQKAKEAERLAYIKKFKFPFSNLTVSEDGELLLAGKPIKEPYFSTGEILRVVPILLSTSNPELKYVFLQDFNLMDEDKQNEIEEYLTGKGFQLVVEMVGKEKVANKSCILLKDNVVVEDYEQASAPMLSL